MKWGLGEGKIDKVALTKWRIFTFYTFEFKDGLQQLLSQPFRIFAPDSNSGRKNSGFMLTFLVFEIQ